MSKLPSWPWFEMFDFGSIAFQLVPGGSLEIFIGRRTIILFNWGRFCGRVFTIWHCDFDIWENP